MSTVHTRKNKNIEQRGNQSASLAACARTIAEDASLASDKTSPARQFAVEPLELPSSVSDISLERGINDATALTAQLHNAELHQAHRPDSPLAAQLFDEMERIRCQAAGIGGMLGVSSNLQVLWHHKTRQPKYKNGNHTDQLILVFSYLTRRALALPCDLSEHTSNIIEQWRDALLSANKPAWDALEHLKHSQSRYLTAALDIISSINEDISSKSHTPLSAKPAIDRESDKDDTEDNVNDSDEEQSDNEIESRDEENENTETVPTEDNNTAFDEDNTRSRDEAVNTDSEAYSNTQNLPTEQYTSYSTAQDEIVYAQKLYNAHQRESLRNTLDEHIETHSRIAGKLAGQLQRLLMANQNRHWKFDLEEGLLDSSRLTRIITQPDYSLSFKQESTLEFKDTIVTILVDNSKSMLGKPIAIAAACTDILAQTLERCGIAVEILGFTTTELHGGPLLNQWKNEGRQTDPGRLNGLRHIIYKSADVPYRRAKSGFGVMLHKDLLKQNIDGEALLWAGERLQRRPETRKILLVISDGAPIDTSTMSANRQNYLVDHLHQVIESIEKTNRIELAAIGIGHDVSTYYKRAITIRDPKDLGKTLLTQFRSLFSPAGNLIAK